MTKKLELTMGLPGTRREGMEMAGVLAGFGLIRQSDGRLPELSRRQRRIERQRRTH